MKVVSLKDYEQEFLDLCKRFYHSNDRNKSWFDPNLNWSIVNRYKKYPFWTFLLDDTENFVAMSCVQTHFFPLNCARLLTRTYYNPDYRRKHLSYETNIKTPAMYMLDEQIKWAQSKNIENMFLSVEYLRRKKSIEKFIKKINDIYLTKWYVLDDLYQTYPKDEDPQSWQVIAANTKTLPLKKMPIDEWKKKYD